MARRERKVVTVVFADLVGFTARAETLDPEDVEAVLGPYHERLRGELEAFGGTVEKFIGDAVMALFGAPVAHEDDPERAVRAALAIRAAAAESDFEVRIAVNTGEALVALDADPRLGEAMAAGDVINTAARLQSAAPVNGVFVGEATYRATRDVIDYRPAKPIEAKGKAEPVPAWMAVDARSPFGVDVRQHGGAPLVGRQRELELLLAAFERARAESAPQLVTLVGVPGMGKSRLMWELFQALDALPDRIRWRQGRCHPYGGLALGALAEIVKAHAGILEDDGPDAAAAKLAQAVAASVPKHEREWVASHLRGLVGLEIEPSHGRDEAFTAWRRLLEGIAEQEPLVLVVEDLQWADDVLLDFVDHLVDWAAGVPILVLCSARPELIERRPGWGGGKLNALVLSLSPLADAETALLLASVLERRVLPADEQARLLERSGGNPLYTEQLARLYEESGSVDGLPEGLQGIVAARLDGLAREEKTLLQNASVLGKVFWTGPLAAMGSEDVETLLHGLERKEFVRRERRAAVGGEAEYAFRHVLVRDVAYGQIPRADRSEKHEASGRWIEELGRPDAHAETVAHHYATARELAVAARRETPGLDERLRAALRAAGERAYGLNAFDAAARHFEDALALWSDDDPDLPVVRFLRSRALARLGRADETELGETARLLEQAGQSELAAEAHVELSDLAWYAGRGEAAAERLAHARELVDPLRDSRAKTWVLSQTARAAMLATRYEEAVELGDRALELALRLELSEISIGTLATLGSSRFYLGDPRGLEQLAESAELARERNAPVLARALHNLGSALRIAGRVPEAAAAYAGSIEAADRFGLVSPALFARANALNVKLNTERWPAVREQAGALAAAAETQGLAIAKRLAFGVRALIQLELGDDAAGDADSARALAVGRDLGDPQSVIPGLATRAAVLVRIGRVEDAIPVAEELLTLTATSPLPFGAGTDTISIAECVGVERWLESLERRVWRSRWADAQAMLLGGDPAGAAALYVEMGATRDAALATLLAGEADLEAGRLDEGRARVDDALDFYRRVGAVRRIAEAEALLSRHADGTAATGS